MANAGGNNNNTSVRKHEAVTGEGHRVEDDGWHEPYETTVPKAPKEAPKTPPKRYMTRYQAAMIIVRWVERRFDQVFWRCERCDRESPYAPSYHHSRVSNFGICESCHSEQRQDDLQRDFDDFDLKRSRFDPDYDGMDNLRWVGPRNTREHLRAWAVHDKRADPRYMYKKRFAMFHEELMMVTWHPSRVAKWLEMGEDVLDMMMGTD